jgi:hypothetical protein
METGGEARGRAGLAEERVLGVTNLVVAGVGYTVLGERRYVFGYGDIPCTKSGVEPWGQYAA